MGGPTLNPDQPFVVPSDGIIKGISVGLTHYLLDGQIEIWIFINDSPSAVHLVNATEMATSLSYQIDLNEILSIITGDRITCYIATSPGYSSDASQQILVDLLLEFPTLVESCFPTTPPVGMVATLSYATAYPVGNIQQYVAYANLMGFIIDDWKRASSPTNESNLPRINSLWGFSENDYYVVFNASLIHHYKDGIWTSESISTSLNNLLCMWGSDENDIWIGADGRDTSSTGMFHWDGENWAPDTTFDGYNILFISGSSSSNIWATGYHNPGADPVIFRYDGGYWTQMVPTTPPAGEYDIFGSISVVNENNVWVYSRRTDPTHLWMNPILQWNGSTWTEHYPETTDPSEFVGGFVLAFSDSDVWAAGDGKAWLHGFVYRHYDAVWHYNGSSWTKTVIRWAADVGGSYTTYTWGINGLGGTSSSSLWIGAPGIANYYDGFSWSDNIASGDWTIYVEVVGGNLKVLGDGSVFVHGRLSSSAVNQYKNGYFRPVTNKIQPFTCNDAIAFDVDNNALAISYDPDTGTNLWKKDTYGWRAENFVFYSYPATPENFRSISAYNQNNILIAGARILQWNGSSWSVPWPGLSASKIYYESLTSVWRSNNSSLYHWNGSAWSLVHTASSTIETFFIIGTHIFIAAGNHIEHSYTGIGGTFLDEATQTTLSNYSGIWGAAWNDVWAVAESSTDYDNSHVNSMHFNGTTWSTANIPVSGYCPNYGSSIVGRSASDIMAMCYYDGYVSRYNGASWSRSSLVTSPGSLVTDGIDYACLSPEAHWQKYSLLANNWLEIEFPISFEAANYPSITTDVTTGDIYVTSSKPGGLFKWNIISGWEYIRIPVIQENSYSAVPYICSIFARNGAVIASDGQGNLYHKPMNSSAWTKMTSGSWPVAPSTCIAGFSDTNFYVSINNTVCRWNGSTWENIIYIPTTSVIFLFLDYGNNMLWGCAGYSGGTPIFYYDTVTSTLIEIPDPVEPPTGDGGSLINNAYVNGYSGGSIDYSGASGSGGDIVNNLDGTATLTTSDSGDWSSFIGGTITLSGSLNPENDGTYNITDAGSNYFTYDNSSAIDESGWAGTWVAPGTTTTLTTNDSGDWSSYIGGNITISGSSDPSNDGIFSITNAGIDYFTYDNGSGSDEPTWTGTWQVETGNYTATLNTTSGDDWSSYIGTTVTISDSSNPANDGTFSITDAGFGYITYDNVSAVTEDPWNGSWIINATPIWGNINSIAACGQNVMAVTGNSGTIRTMNRFATSWDSVTLPIGSVAILRVWSDDSGKFYCCSQEATGILKIYYTNDLGDTWSLWGTQVGLAGFQNIDENWLT